MGRRSKPRRHHICRNVMKKNLFQSWSTLLKTTYSVWFIYDSIYANLGVLRGGGHFDSKPCFYDTQNSNCWRIKHSCFLYLSYLYFVKMSWTMWYSVWLECTEENSIKFSILWYYTNGYDVRTLIKMLIHVQVITIVCFRQYGTICLQNTTCRTATVYGEISREPG